jgi:hypothetical protein
MKDSRRCGSAGKPSAGKPALRTGKQAIGKSEKGMRDSRRCGSAGKLQTQQASRRCGPAGKPLASQRSIELLDSRPFSPASGLPAEDLLAGS